MKHYKSMILIGTFLFILICVYCLFYKDKVFNVDNTNKSISIQYEKNKNINITKINQGLVYSNKFTITNNTKNTKYYSIVWKNIKNTFKQQNKLLYVLDTHDSDAGFLGDSQIPASEFVLFDRIMLKSKHTHTYELRINYIGDPYNENNSFFTGILEVKTLDK